MKKLYLTDVEAELLTEALESAWSVLEDKVNGSSNSAFRKYWQEKQAWYEELQCTIEASEEIHVEDEVQDEAYEPMISEERIDEIVNELKFPEIRRTEGENWND